MSKRERFKLDCSVFVLLARDEQFCFLQRTGTGWKDGFYSVPAGALEPGETLISAAIREAREEVGLKLQPDQLRLVHTMHCRTEGNEWLGHFFHGPTLERRTEFARAGQAQQPDLGVRHATAKPIAAICATGAQGDHAQSTLFRVRLG
jgi:8-oxo-dGTP pyrophosphatase MutT (NUDIX family)